jgi:hypothetical protein
VRYRSLDDVVAAVCRATARLTGRREPRPLVFPHDDVSKKSSVNLYRFLLSDH